MPPNSLCPCSLTRARSTRSTYRPRRNHLWLLVSPFHFAVVFSLSTLFLLADSQFTDSLTRPVCSFVSSGSTQQQRRRQQAGMAAERRAAAPHSVSSIHSEYSSPPTSQSQILMQRGSGHWLIQKIPNLNQANQLSKNSPLPFIFGYNFHTSSHEQIRGGWN